MKNLLKYLPIFFFLLFTHACEIETDVDIVRENIIGTWIEKKPYSDNICDTLIFGITGEIESYLNLAGYKYNIISSDTLVVENVVGLDRYYCIEMIENEMTIFNFPDRFAGSIQTDITFKKIDPN